MNREQLAEILRAASIITDDRPVVMGSQAILGSYDEADLPEAATMSMEADVAFLNDADRAKADLVTGAIGEDSNFHQLRGYYAEGIHVETAILPEGWRDRLIAVPVPPGPTTNGTVAAFLDPHDLVVAKMAAFREKDIRFVTELVRADLVDPTIALERLEKTTLHPVARQRATGVLQGLVPEPIPEPVPEQESATERAGRLDLEPPDAAGEASRLRRSQRLSGDPGSPGEPPAPGPRHGSF